MSYTMAALAGLVARDKPQLFLVQASGDQPWLNYIYQNYLMQGNSITNAQVSRPQHAGRLPATTATYLVSLICPAVGHHQKHRKRIR
jgi:hypothetical protein